MKARLRLIGSILFILLLFAVLFSYAMFQGGFVSWFLFYSFLPIMLYHFLLLCYPMKKWTLRRESSRRVLRAGDTARLTLRVERKFPFPLYYGVFEEMLPEELNREDRKSENYTLLNDPEKLAVKRRMKKMVPVGFKRELSIPYSLEALPRGALQLGSVRVLVSDVFGFVKKEHIFEVTDMLFVQPNEREVRLISGTSSFEQGQTAADSFQMKNTNVATGVREYAPGDQFSWIHWKQTARNQNIMTKEFEQERSNRLLLVLDACRPKRWNPLAFEANVELTLALLKKFGKTRFDVDLLTLGREIRNFSITDSYQLHEGVHQHLTSIQPDGELPFSRMLKETLQEENKLERVIILTSSVDDFFREAVQTLKQRGSQVVIFYTQGSRLIAEEEQASFAQMKREGTPVHILTEKELAKAPLEVSLR
jgi:uncharacterized protein (DUF58 family)